MIAEEYKCRRENERMSNFFSLGTKSKCVFFRNSQEGNKTLEIQCLCLETQYSDKHMYGSLGFKRQIFSSCTTFSKVHLKALMPNYSIIFLIATMFANFFL